VIWQKPEDAKGGYYVDKKAEKSGKSRKRRGAYRDSCRITWKRLELFWIRAIRDFRSGKKRKNLGIRAVFYRALIPLAEMIIYL
jgi:hypothetical protein